MSTTVRASRVSVPAARQPRRIWIPPWALATGHAAHGLSWILLAVLASRDQLIFSFPGLAWIHLVALGWLTLTSLAVLVHVVPGFLGVKWRAEGLARWSLLPFVLGMVGMVASFWLSEPKGLAHSATLVVVSLVAYLGAAFATLASFEPGEVRLRVQRAFYVVLSLLAVTAGFGVAMAYGLAHGPAMGLAEGTLAWLLTAGLKLHAHLGAIGWLSILVFGVSVRTVRPITGGPSPYPWLHGIVSAGTTVGLGLLVLGLAFDQGAAILGGAGLIGIGALAYLADMAIIVRRARVPHRPPQAFLLAGAFHYAIAAVLGFGVATGKVDWQPVYAFVGLMGWLGQMVNGHLHHIGIRVLATVVLGDEDETKPWQLLRKPLSWTAWGLFQVAVWTVAAGLLTGSESAVLAGAGLGFAGWCTMSLNVAGAWRKARTLAISGHSAS